MQYIPVQRRCRPSDSASFDNVLLDHIWSFNPRGVVGYKNIRAKHRNGPGSHWSYYSVVYMVPTTPGAHANIALGRLDTCPPFTGELLVIRRSENGQYVLDMKYLDRQKAEVAVTT